MATSDLLNELNKEGFKADSDLEIKLSNIILQQLDDVAGDVSGLAVKCLAPLVKKVGEPRVVEMTNKLFEKLLNSKDQHRDIASIALKTIIAEISTPSLAQSVLISISPQLIRGITGGVSSFDNRNLLRLPRLWKRVDHLPHNHLIGDYFSKSLETIDNHGKSIHHSLDVFIGFHLEILVAMWAPEVEAISLSVVLGIGRASSRIISSGIGELLKDTEGKKLEYFSVASGPGPPVLAELKAIQAGLKMFLALKWKDKGRLILETDSLVAVN
ncbi:Detected protein of unknown function [Hibiscus syriacus]|uniref:Uncharacterized protein n=1 Tax=Hibiscus syriacus TaxID=106335 RepID=A0A6A3D4X3_HIBSY|nr:Detected protein of unknown function [Hibiscus syriacus]